MLWRSGLESPKADSMRHQSFHIGLEFWCGGKKWRCTDIGTRVITAICLEPHEVVEVGVEHSDESRVITSDPSWHVGPPYQIPEHVFDEYDLPACSLHTSR